MYKSDVCLVCSIATLNWIWVDLSILRVVLLPSIVVASDRGGARNLPAERLGLPIGGLK